MQHFNYSLVDIEGMMPWEREIYTVMLHQYLEEKHREEQQQSLR